MSVCYKANVQLKLQCQTSTHFCSHIHTSEVYLS